MPPPLLNPTGVNSSSAGAARQPARAASAVVAKPARGFQLFRIDGYSWTTTLPGGERISSQPFYVGGNACQIDYYPNGTDACTPDADAIAVYLRLVSAACQGGYGDASGERVRAEFKFSLLDLAGKPAYELPAETGVFTPVDDNDYLYERDDDEKGPAVEANRLGCGIAGFIAREELERRRRSLVAEDRLVIRCDVGVAQVEEVAVEVKRRRFAHAPCSSSRGYGGGGGYESECSY